VSAARGVPRPDGLNGEFYAHARAGQLCFQRCDGCDAWRHPPRRRCPACGSDLYRWEASAGRGRLFSWTVTHHAFDPAFADRVPYVTGLVEMAEGPRVVALVDGDRSELRLDRDVVVAFDPSVPDTGLLVCRLV
jgi:uncharacterized OB-fold protein